MRGHRCLPGRPGGGSAAAAAWAAAYLESVGSRVVIDGLPGSHDGSCGGPLVIGGWAGGGVYGVTYPDLPVFEDVGS